MEHIYHYTTQLHLARIKKSGLLIPNTPFAPTERPLLWFSFAPFWEPSIDKMVVSGGRIVPLSFEMLRKHVGCVRFLLPASDTRLLGVDEAFEHAGTRQHLKTELLRRARLDGGKPEEWRAVLTPIPLSDLSLQSLEGDKWVNCQEQQPAHTAAGRIATPQPRPVRDVAPRRSASVQGTIFAEAER